MRQPTKRGGIVMLHRGIITHAFGAHAHYVPDNGDAHADGTTRAPETEMLAAILEYHILVPAILAVAAGSFYVREYLSPRPGPRLNR